MKDFFKVKEHGSDVKTEVMAGITTFMAMAYILVVNPAIFSKIDGVAYDAVYIATVVSAIIGTLIIGLLANLPLAQASGMGLTAFFVYTVCMGMGFTYANALVMVLFDGVVFIILTITGVRQIIFESIPKCVRIAMPAGIGLFIMFLGLQDSGLVVNNESTCVGLASFNFVAKSATWSGIMPLLITIITLMIIAILSVRKVKGSILWGMLSGTALYYIFGMTIKGFYKGFFDGVSLNPFAAFGTFFDKSFLKVITEGFDFSTYLSSHSTTSLVVLLVTTSLAFCMVDMFDTLATLYGACSRGDMLTEDGQVPNFEKAMLSDAIATVFGSLLGTSTVTTYVEASAGVAVGGRTGLSAMVTGALFFISMFLSPVAKLIPGAVTAAALIYVGVLMMKCVTDIDWLDESVSVPAFLTLTMMPFTYNISYGIAFGLISYIIIAIFTGKKKNVNVGTVVIGLFFAVMFLVSH